MAIFDRLTIELDFLIEYNTATCFVTRAKLKMCIELWCIDFNSVRYLE